MQYRLDIQGLRAIAVISVFLFHLNKNLLPGGFVGVDVFFVISGFLISSIILGRKEKGNFSYRNFYLGRIKRIVPACYAMIATAVAAGSMLYLYTDMLLLKRSAISAATFLSNWYFTRLDTYFGATASENPFLHTWTLGVEMQFYLLLPLLIMLFSKKKLRYVVAGASVLLLAYCQINLMNETKHVQMYYSLLSRMPEFFLGVGINLLGTRARDYFRGKNIYAVAGLAMILCSVLFFSEDILFPGLTVLIPCVGTCLIILSEGSAVNTTISKKVPVYLGEISYSLYLWHWPVFAMFRYYNGQYELSLPGGLAACAIILLLALGSYYLIEKPIRKLSGPRFGILFAATTVIMGILAYGMTRMNRMISKEFPDRYISPIALGLETHYFKADSLAMLGDPVAEVEFLIVGDSHGLCYKAYFDELGKRNNFALHSITNDSYPPIEGLPESSFKTPSQYAHYLELVESVKDNVKTKKNIIFSMYWRNVDRYPNLEEVIENFIKSFGKDQNVIFVTDFPVTDINAFRKYKTVSKTGDKQYKIDLITYEIPQSIRDIIEKYPNASILDVDCGELCKDAPFYNDSLIYYDEHHLNRYAMDNLARLTERETMDALARYLSDDSGLPE